MLLKLENQLVTVYTKHFQGRCSFICRDCLALVENRKIECLGRHQTPDLCVRKNTVV